MASPGSVKSWNLDKYTTIVDENKDINEVSEKTGAKEHKLISALLVVRFAWDKWQYEGDMT